jgi:hypothetical protein
MKELSDVVALENTRTRSLWITMRLQCCDLVLRFLPSKRNGWVHFAEATLIYGDAVNNPSSGLVD